MFKTTTKTIKSLSKTKLKRRGEEIEMRAKRKKWTKWGRGVVLYANFSVGNSVGNKLKCAPKISKMPPVFFRSVGNCASNKHALQDVRFLSVIPVGDSRRWCPSEIVEQLRNFLTTLCEILTALGRRYTRR